MEQPPLVGHIPVPSGCRDAQPDSSFAHDQRTEKT
jgi:hypothetical protein